MTDTAEPHPQPDSGLRDRAEAALAPIGRRLRSWRAGGSSDPGDGPAVPRPRLEARVAALEEAVEENRRLNQRLADIVDVVTEILVPVADRDDERLKRALAQLNKTLDPPAES